MLLHLLRRRKELLLVVMAVVPAKHGRDLVVRRREVVEGGRGTGGGGRVRSAGAEGDGEGGEVGRDGARARGGDDGGLRLLEQPLDGLAVRLVAQLPRELEQPRRAHRRHPYPPPTPLHGLLLRAAGRSGRRRRLRQLHLPGPGAGRGGLHDGSSRRSAPRRGGVVERVVRLPHRVVLLLGSTPAAVGAGASAARRRFHGASSL